MKWDEVLLMVGIVLFIQLWSWGAWCFAQIFLLEYRSYKRLRYAILPKWTYLPPDSMGSRIEGALSGVVFGGVGLVLNTLCANPGPLFRDLHLPYLGLSVNLVVLGLILRETMCRQPLPLPGKYQLLSFLQFTIRGNRCHRVFASMTAIVMAFGAWLLPWCCS
jgi:hypothetical protein